MKSLCHILLSFIVLWSSTAWASTSTAFSRLDSLIAGHDVRVKYKEIQINKIKRNLQRALSPDKEYDINNQLYSQYVEFQNDSAQKFMRRNIEIAQELNDKDKLNESTLNLMHLLTKAYLLDETINMAGDIDTTTLSNEKRLYYYKIL
ncbi:MAG: hypothetical protein II462_01245, partial [Muribaculaceae bacterium]|nr:hypothetical protein [Muribaculaceae bacterium]